MEIDYQSKLIEIASKELDIDLKKVSNPHPRVLSPNITQHSYQMKHLYALCGIPNKHIIKCSVESKNGR
jgi:hypothetical protein